MDLRDKFLGTMLGLAIGDALGAPFEGRSRAFMAKMDDLAAGYEKMPGYPIGQYTDDTQMTLKLSESIISKGKVDGADIADKFASLWRNNVIIGGGAACRDAMMNIIVHGKGWDECGAEEGRAGNGTAMRTAPVGLFDYDDPAALRDDAVTQSIITHKDPRASAAAVAVAGAISYCIDNDTIEPGRLLGFLTDLTGGISEELTAALTDLNDIVTLDREPAFKRIAAYCGQGDDFVHGITGYAVPTVMAALYNFLRSPGDWVKSVEGALDFGGDVDTVASITGAISGSANGVHALPKNLIEDLKDYEYVQGIALTLYDVTCNK